MGKWPYKTLGIPDEQFIRDQVPMTKEEVRVVTLAKARLSEDHIIYDIGAGTGSISIEAARQASRGTVYAIEKNPLALDLIKRNKTAFEIVNVEIVAGEAPAALNNLPAPDRVIIGGSGGNLAEILALIESKTEKPIRIIVNAIVLETLFSAVQYFKESDYEVEITQVAVTKAKNISDLHMMQAQNPVFIVSAERRAK